MISRILPMPITRAARHVRASGRTRRGLACVALLCALWTACPSFAIAAPAAGPPGVLSREPALKIEIEREPNMDVGLALDQDSLVVRPASRLALHLSTGGADQPLGETSGPIEIHSVEGQWEIAWGDSGGEVRSTVLPVLDTLWITGTEADPEAHRMRWNGKTWRGMGKVFVGPRGRLTFALRLPLESYLLGVIPGEIGSLGPDLMQAGRAQAIAARSYTLFYRGRRGSEGFDLYGTVEDQVYGPIESERPLATDVVRTTAGWVALYEGNAIRANYSSTCGGISADVWEAWPDAPRGYLVSHRDLSPAGDFCATSPHYRWNESWLPGEFLANIAKFAPLQGLRVPPDGIGELVDIVTERRSRSGRVWQLVVKGSRGQIRIPAYSIRQVLRRGGNEKAILRSNLFKIDVRRNRATRRAVAVVANGAGSGHGVGLCQTGALGMARAGKPAEAIIQHYYPGIDLKRLY